MAAEAKRGLGQLFWIVGLALMVSVAVAIAWAGKASAVANHVLRSEMTAGGVKVDTLAEGKGPFATAADTVRVIYTGKLANGTVFDSNVGKAPLEFPLGQVIKGWQEGLQKMRAGGRARLSIPAAMGYGAAGAGGTIPPNANLVFDVQLIAINPR